jgi:hypothetical protein
MMDLLKVDTSREEPTMEAPAHGMVATVVNGRKLPLSEAEYWLHEGTYVVRSKEFDCFAEGATLDEALMAFGRAVYAYAYALEQRDDHGEATESERENLRQLSRRLSRIYLEERRQSSSQLRGLSRWRRARESRRAWEPTPTI